MPLTRECFSQIVDLLTPHMLDPNERQVILRPALYDTPLLNQIMFSGNANTFTVLLVTELDRYGRVTRDKTALTAVLEALQGHVGWDRQEKIKELIACAETGTDIPHVDVAAIPDLPQASNDVEKNHIFISYSSTDRVSFVDRLAGDLVAFGHTVWVDNLDEKYGGIVAGKPWQQELANALNHAKLVVFVITPDSIRSKWVKAELKRAGETGLRVIGVIARPLRSAEDRSLLGHIQVGVHTMNDLHYHDFTQIGYEAGLKALLKDVDS